VIPPPPWTRIKKRSDNLPGIKKSSINQLKVFVPGSFSGPEKVITWNRSRDKKKSPG
jgi:hypothetical protein